MKLKKFDEYKDEVFEFIAANQKNIFDEICSQHEILLFKSNFQEKAMGK
jgi:hypothetical protein